MPPDNSPLRLLCLEYCDFVNSAVLDLCDLAVTRHTCHNCDLGGDVCQGASFLGGSNPRGRVIRPPVYPLFLRSCLEEKGFVLR